MKRRTVKCRRRSRRPRARGRGRKRTRARRRTGGARKPGTQFARFRRNIYAALNRGPGGTTPPDLAPYIHWNESDNGVVVTAKAIGNPGAAVFTKYNIGGKYRFLKNMNEAFTFQMREVNGDRTYSSPYVQRGHPDMLSEQYAVPHPAGTLPKPAPAPAVVAKPPVSPSAPEQDELPDIGDADLATVFAQLSDDERSRSVSPAFIR